MRSEAPKEHLSSLPQNSDVSSVHYGYPDLVREMCMDVDLWYSCASTTIDAENRVLVLKTLTKFRLSNIYVKNLDVSQC